MKKKDYRVLGVMSGTSLDGIDIAYLKFGKNSSWEYQIEKAETLPYPQEWQEKLAEAVTYKQDDLEKLDEEYTGFLAKRISSFVADHKVEDLDAVCSHGHTIKHEPQNSYTFQIGNLPKLAELIQEKVVCDFRVQDVKMGGQGAPLVPIGDELLFREYEYCLNLGGFANISTRLNGKRVAFDICAVNTVMNHLAEKTGVPYDKDGEIAASGELDEKLLERLNALEFYSLQPPKSLGIEWVQEHIFPLMKEWENIPTFLHTYVHHIAKKISESFDNDPQSKVLVTGGGAFNSFLMDVMKGMTKNKIVIPSAEVVNFKEALIFGFLGILRLENEINVLGSVTGAPKDHSSGNIFNPRK